MTVRPSSPATRIPPTAEFNPKRFVVVKPDEQPREYRSVISHLTIDLPDDPLQYTAVPNADLKEGIWGEAGVNEANVAMSATETLTTNERVLGADPFVEYRAARGQEGDSGLRAGRARRHRRGGLPDHRAAVRHHRA